MLFGEDLPVEPGVSDDPPIVLPESYAVSLENEGGIEELEVFSTYCHFRDARPKPQASQIKSALQIMNAHDHKVVHILEQALDPRLLEIARAMFIPGKLSDLDNVDLEENRLRDSFLNMIMDDESVSQLSGKLHYVGGRLYRGNEVVCDAGPFTTMEYVFRTFPREAYKIYCSIRDDLGKDSRDWNRVGYRNMLSYFRQYRNLSRSMNRITKMAQLEHLDGDSSYFWFDDVEYDEDDSPLVVGVDDYRVLMRFPHSTLVKADEFIENCERFYDVNILANVVVADAEGGYRNNQKLLRALKKASQAGSCVRVHMVVDSSVDLRGVVLRKPRPHNLTVIVYLDDVLEDLAPVFNDMIENIREANVTRNMMMLRGTPGVRKRPYRSWSSVLHHLVQMMVLHGEEISYIRNVMRKRDVKSKKPRPPSVVSRRIHDIRYYLSCKDVVFEGDWYAMKPVMLYEGPIEWFVPPIGPVHVAINSCVRYAATKGFRPLYVLGTWHFTKYF